MPAEGASVDHYAALQISTNAQNNEIKSSYRKLALLYHPDRNHGNEAEASRKFQAIQAAYEVLIDATKRAKYDRVRLTTGTGTASTVTKDGFTTSTSTTATRAQAATKAPSNTAKRYTSTAGYARSTMKTDTRANDFKQSSSGAYSKTSYRDTDREKTKSSDDDKKRREREKEHERASKSYSSKPKADYGRPESPRTSTPKRSKESQNTSAYAQSYYMRSRGMSPDLSHTSSTRATTGPSGDSDPDSYPTGRSWSASKSRYTYTPDTMSERFTNLRPSSPIPEARRSDGHRYQRYPEPSRYFYGSPVPEERYGRYSSHGERRKSRKSDEYEKQHVPPSPPPDKERDQAKFKYTGIPSDEDSVPNLGRRSSQSKKSGSASRSRRPYFESEDSDDGIKADDEKAPDDRSFEEKIKSMDSGQKKDEEVKSNGRGGLKDPRPRSPRLATMAPETPRRTPSPYATSPGKNAYFPMSEKKKVPLGSTAPLNVHMQAAPPPPLEPQSTQAPGVFAFQIPNSTPEAPIPPDRRKPFTPSYTQLPSQPRVTQYQSPVFATQPTLPSAPLQMNPNMRPASTQPMSTGYPNFSPATGLSETELRNVAEGLAPGLSKKKSEPGLKSRHPRSKGAKPKLSTKFSEMSISGNSSPVKENTSDGSKSIFGDTSSREDLKQKREKEAEYSASKPTPMDIDSPVPPQPPLNFQSPLSAKFEPTLHGYAADIPLPASPSNGFPKPTDLPVHQKPDPLSTFHNLANLHPINTAENLESLDGVAYLKPTRGFKSQTPSTLNLGGKSRDKLEARSPVENTFPLPPKPPTLPLPIRLDASKKLDNVAYQPYWDSMQMYVDQWREYEMKMISLLRQKLDSSGVEFRDLLTDIKAARDYQAKYKEEKALREEWDSQKARFVQQIVEYYQLKNDVSHKMGPQPVSTNTSFLGNIGKKSKLTRIPTFNGVQVVGESGLTSEAPSN